MENSQCRKGMEKRETEDINRIRLLTKQKAQKHFAQRNAILNLFTNPFSELFSLEFLVNNTDEYIYQEIYGTMEFRLNQ